MSTHDEVATSVGYRKRSANPLAHCRPVQFMDWNGLELLGDNTDPQ
jgi:hypothetical protein